MGIRRTHSRLKPRVPTGEKVKGKKKRNPDRPTIKISAMLQETNIFFIWPYCGNFPPRGPGGGGGLSQECVHPYHSGWIVSRRLNGAVMSYSPYESTGWFSVGARMGTLKNPTKCLWRLKKKKRSNFFFRPTAHLCTVKNISAISLIMTLNKHIYLIWPYCGNFEFITSLW